MDYEKRFKRLCSDLTGLITKHIMEWEEAENGGYDVDEQMELAKAPPTRPVVPKARHGERGGTRRVK